VRGHQSGQSNDRTAPVRAFDEREQHAGVVAAAVRPGQQPGVFRAREPAAEGLGSEQQAPAGGHEERWAQEPRRELDPPRGVLGAARRLLCRAARGVLLAVECRRRRPPIVGMRRLAHCQLVPNGDRDNGLGRGEGSDIP